MPRAKIETMTRIDDPAPDVRLRPGYLLGTLLVTAAVAAGMAYASAREVRRDLLRRSRQYGGLISKHVYLELVSRHRLTTPDALARQLADPTLAPGIHASLADSVSGLEIHELKLFDRGGRRIAQLGGDGSRRDEAPNTAVAKALAGEAIGELIAAGAPTHEGGAPRAVAVLETYWPIYHATEDPTPSYVIEVYQDASELERQFASAYWRIGRSLLVALGVLAGFLLVSITHANRTIRAQTRALQESNQHLEQLRAELEARVEERSRRLVQSEKLVSLGRLAAGVAHELNTPLASISACSEGLMRQAERPQTDPQALRQRTAEYHRVIRDEAFRCKEITQALLGLSRAAPTRLEPTLLGPLVERTLALLQYRAERAGITLRSTIESPLPPVAADPGQLQQVLLNLTTNALDACSAGGQIVWRAARTADGLELTCTDDGSGIEAEALPAILDPFYTTKPPGQGTGLGLTLCHELLTAAGGTLDVVSPGPGQGTLATVRLPLESADA